MIASSQAPLARLQGIEKRFGSVRALSGAELTVEPGVVHGVLGENGAGKTTLLNVLAGMIRPDAGTVEVGGRPVTLRTPRDAWQAGVGMVHQHFTLVPTLSVLENLALGLRSKSGGLGLPYEALGKEARTLMERTGLAVPLGARVEELGVGDRQRVEILKTLLREPRVLVLDEPTAVLAPGEVERLFALLRELAEKGRGVVLVAHKLDEVLGVADRVTVLRRGRTVLTAPAEEVEPAGLVRAMVGRNVADGAAVGALELQAPEGRHSAPEGPPVAVLEDVSVRGREGQWALEGVDFSVRPGEVLGVAGVEGNGQRELALVLAGRLDPDRGRASIPDRVGFVPQDRTREGVVADFDLTENVALALHRDPAFLRGPLMRWSRIRSRTAELMERFDVRAPGAEALARSLSGGNQQRLVVARELTVAGGLLVAENPTRGLDVAAAAFVHRALRELAQGRGGEPGPGVVLISTDLDEVLALSDQVQVLVRGRLRPVPADRRTREGVGELMLGA